MDFLAKQSNHKLPVCPTETRRPSLSHRRRNFQRGSLDNRTVEFMFLIILLKKYGFRKLTIQIDFSVEKRQNVASQNTFPIP